MDLLAEDATGGNRLWAIGTSLGLTVMGFFVPLLLVLLVASIFANAGVPLSTERNPLVTYPTLTVIQGAGFAIVVAIFIRVIDLPGLIQARVPTLRELAMIVGGLIALLGALAGVSVLYAQLDVATAQNQIVGIGRQHPTLMLYMLPLAILVIGPTEELLFRGAIQGILRRVYTAGPAIVLASLFFALAHFTALGSAATLLAKAATLTAILVLSLVLGAVYEYTDNLVVPALVHGLYDAVIFVAIYLQAMGMA